jgi:hypothetical protein
MNRNILFLSFCLLISYTATSQQKITQYLHQKDYINYNEDFFQKISRDLYVLAFEGKIKGYADVDLGRAYIINEIRQRGQWCEMVRVAFASCEDCVKDSLICTYFDYFDKQIILDFDKSINQSPDFRKNVAVALCYDSSKTRKVLFYISYPDFLDKLPKDESEFLAGYIGMKNTLNLNSGNLVLDSSQMAAYALSQYKAVFRILANAGREHYLSLYSNDSLTRKFTDANYKILESMFTDNAVAIDSDSECGIIVISDIEKSGDDQLIKKPAVGILGAAFINSVTIYKVPAFYAAYPDVKRLFNIKQDYSESQSINTLENVAQYQFIHRTSEEYLKN